MAGQPASAQIETLVQFAPPPMSSPGNREAGGQRHDTCADTTNASGLMALVPESNVGLTVQASPNLFAYVPPNNAEQAELRIFEEETGEEVFAGKVALPTSPAGSEYSYREAIVNMPLEALPVTLQPGQNYLWALMLVCNRNNRAEDIVVDVVVQRIGDEYLDTLTTEVAAPLAGEDPVAADAELTLYADAGLWQDLLAVLAARKQAEPERYTAVWSDLLTAQGMGAIADAPIYQANLQPLNP
jgi:hypothetical protein